MKRCRFVAETRVGGPPLCRGRGEGRLCAAKKNDVQLSHPNLSPYLFSNLTYSRIQPTPTSLIISSPSAATGWFRHRPPHLLVNTVASRQQHQSVGGGMPSAFASHGSMSERDDHVLGEKRSNSDGALSVAAGERPIDKQSFDYVWRTGVAGGIAGCAVSRHPEARCCCGLC